PDSVEDLDRVALAQIPREPVLEPRLDRLLVERLADLLARLVEGTVARRLELVDADDLHGPIGADDLAHRPGRHHEDHLLEVRVARTAREGPEQATSLGSLRLRELLRQVLEAPAAEGELPDLLGLALDVLDLALAVDRLDAEDDRAHGHAIARPEILAVGLVVALDLVGRHAHTTPDLAGTAVWSH